MRAEGGDNLELVAGDKIEATTTIGTGLTFTAGKLAVAGTGDRVWGILSAVLAAEDPDNNTFSILVTRAEGAKVA